MCFTWEGDDRAGIAVSIHHRAFLHLAVTAFAVTPVSSADACPVPSRPLRPAHRRSPQQPAPSPNRQRPRLPLARQVRQFIEIGEVLPHRSGCGVGLADSDSWNISKAQSVTNLR
jgi:hypothetical protein